LADGRPGGEVIVFESVDGGLPCDAWYRNGTDIVRQYFLKSGQEPDICDPAALRRYFEILYRSGQLDPRNIQGLRKHLAFEQVAGAYRLIDENTASVVCINWKQGRDQVQHLLSQMKNGPGRAVYRELGRYSVNLFESDARKLRKLMEAADSGVVICHARYDDELGLMHEVDASTLMV
jgi:hypothetical protein